jgi:diguanylate cyclase (GGDEF)-like protein
MDTKSQSHVVAPAVVNHGAGRHSPPREKQGRAEQEAAVRDSELQRTCAELFDTKRALLTSQRELRTATQRINRLTTANARLRRELLQRVHGEARAERLAYQDELTKLPNRRVLLDRMRQAIARSARQNSKIALLWLDLDGFKGVNDWLGHAAGDKLLKEAGERLAASIRESDTACRYGGDEFAVMLADIGDMQSVNSVAAKIRDRLCEPYVIDDCEVRITVSFGTATFPDDAQGADDLVKKADATMYRSKPLHRAASIAPLPRDNSTQR